MIVRDDDRLAISLSGVRLLVVDDERHVRLSLRTGLAQAGATCLEASSGREALQVLDGEESPVDIVLSDIRMPGMDGRELLSILRERYPSVGVIICTSVNDVSTAMECVANGAMDYLTKPFTLEEVRMRAGAVLDRLRLRQEAEAYRSSLEERVQEQARRLEFLFLAAMQALADTLELKDPYTSGHSVRVARYAAAIARTMQLEPEMVEQIHLGGRLHDLGKIGVQESVLRKPGPLTTDEYTHIMTHPVLGWRILLPLLADRQISLNVVRFHHERFDGKGVPDRLAGSAIPLEARIAAVADSYDAMLSGRPYRRDGLSQDVAVAELRRCAGAQFDPDVVDAFCRALEAGFDDDEV